MHFQIMILAFSFVWLFFTPTAFATGDCNNDKTVTIAEVQTAINMFLGLKPTELCVDEDKSGSVSIAEVQKTINSFLGLAPTGVTVPVSAGNTTPYDASTACVTFEFESNTSLTYNVSGFAACDKLVFGSGFEPEVSANISGTDGVIEITATSKPSATQDSVQIIVNLTGIAAASSTDPDNNIWGANSFRTVFGADSLQPITPY
jgi:hypothetical protein